MIKNIVLDIGGVQLLGDDAKHLALMVADGIPEEEGRQVQKLLAHFDEWRLGDRGLLSLDEIMAISIRRAPQLESAFRSYYAHCTDHLSIPKVTFEVLDRIKKAGLGLYYLSNLAVTTEKAIADRWHLFDLFDGGILSYKVQALKPEKEIYEALLNTYGLVPQECLFCDDSQKNCEGALKLGLDAVRVENPTVLEERLKEKGIEI